MYQYASKGKSQSEKSKSDASTTNKNHAQAALKIPVQTKSLFSLSFNAANDSEKLKSNDTSSLAPLTAMTYSPLQMKLMPKQEQREIQPLPINSREEQNRLEPVSTKLNNTGISLQMKERFESLSGFSFDDVRVRYNSDKPEQLGSFAYTQGNQVYIGPRQEHHLRHELGHVVQQKQGLVVATSRVGNLPVNDSPELEAKADRLSDQAVRIIPPTTNERAPCGIVQCMAMFNVTTQSFARYKKQGWQAVRKAETLINNSLPYAPEVTIQSIIETLEALPAENPKKVDSITVVSGLKDYKDLLPVSANATVGQVRKEGGYTKYTADQEETTYNAVGAAENSGHTANIENTPEKIVGHNDYKMDALHMVALKAQALIESVPNTKVGPHIAISHVHGKIFAAVNSYYALKTGEIRATVDQIQTGITNAMNDLATGADPLTEQLITDLSLDKNMEREARQRRHLRLQHTTYNGMIKAYIAGIRAKPVVAVVAGDVGLNPIAAIHSTHGEMIVAAKIERERTLSNLLQDKTAKVRSLADPNIFASIRVGGTLIDCEDCSHKHHGGSHTGTPMNTLRDTTTTGVGVAPTMNPTTDSGTSHDASFGVSSQSHILSSSTHGESFRFWSHSGMLRVKVPVEDIKADATRAYYKAAQETRDRLGTYVLQVTGKLANAMVGISNQTITNMVNRQRTGIAMTTILAGHNLGAVLGAHIDGVRTLLENLIQVTETVTRTQYQDANAAIDKLETLCLYVRTNAAAYAARNPLVMPDALIFYEAQQIFPGAVMGAGMPPLQPPLPPPLPVVPILAG